MSAALRRAAQIAGLEVTRVVRPRSRHLVLRGLRHHFLDWGKRGRPPVVWLHGGLLTAHTWDLVCLTLRNDWRCLALDQRGHGDSEWSPEPDYRPAAYVADLEAFADQLRLERFVLVGQSMGGLHALGYAGRHPKRVAGLVIVDVPAQHRENAGVRRLRAFARRPIGAGSLDTLVARAMRFNPRRRPELLRRSLLHNLRRTPDGRFTWKYDPRLRTGGLGDLAERLREARRGVAKIACPALVVHGAESDIVSAAQSRRLAGLLSRGRWAQIQSAGHTVQGDNPKALAELLAPFLAECFGRGRSELRHWGNFSARRATRRALPQSEAIVRARAGASRGMDLARHRDVPRG